MAKQQWTTENIPDLTGNVAIVTGANSGLGFETAKAFAGKGAQVVLACRDIEKAETAQSRIRAELPTAKTAIMQLDLASLESVRQFADRFKATHDHLDILVNNAGVAALHYNTTAEGFELCVGVNHLGHFALTGLLIDALEKSTAARVVSVSSIGHRQGEMDFDNLTFQDGKDFSLAAAYGRSKLANLLFAYELQRRLVTAESGVTSVAAHPGLAQTDLGRSMIEKWQWRLMLQLYGLLGLSQSAAMGALPI
ncbi:MAG TPA: oxidoreductase, partial [Caldilineaceae bacterium]|nr:oxidoreductase [Caldilineaceae bacterium]